MEQLYKRYLEESKAIRVEDGIVMIPDISGYTKFVNSICIEAGRYITRELLSVILEANSTRLEVSEIEGDAILFYKFGPKPSVEAIVRQYEEMLSSFNAKLRDIEDIVGHRLNLSLKLIAHYGSFSEYTIGAFKKLYGEPVVRAHALLKNNVESNTYILLTGSLATLQAEEQSRDFFLIDYDQQNIYAHHKKTKHGTGYQTSIRQVGLQPNVV